MLLHTRDQDELVVSRTRVQNSSQGIDHLSDEGLLSMFSIAIADDHVAPEFLASVCDRWKVVVSGDVGASLWTTIDINVKPRATSADLAKRVLRFVERSRSRPLTLILRGVRMARRRCFRTFVRGNEV